MKAGGEGVIDRYVEAQPEPVRTTLAKLCQMIRRRVPAGTVEGLSYGMPCFQCGGPLVGFRAFAKHWSLFPMSGGVVEKLADELRGHATSKGTIRFAPDELPKAALLEKILATRMDEIGSRKPARKPAAKRS